MLSSIGAAKRKNKDKSEPGPPAWGRLLSTPCSNHLPSFFEPFIYVRLGERSDAARDVVGLAGCQNRLAGLFHFGRILGHAKILVQITSRTEEDRPDTRHRRNLVDVLQALQRFYHGNCEQIAFRIERPNVGVPLVLSRGDAPRKNCISRTVATQSWRLLVLRRFLLRIAHVPNQPRHLLLVIHTIKD